MKRTKDSQFSFVAISDVLNDVFYELHPQGEETATTQILAKLVCWIEYLSEINCNHPKTRRHIMARSEYQNRNEQNNKGQYKIPKKRRGSRIIAGRG
jgi:hypothetical protein